MSATNTTAEYLLWPDYIVVAIYFISVLVIGIWVILLTIFLVSSRTIFPVRLNRLIFKINSSNRVHQFNLMAIFYYYYSGILLQYLTGTNKKL